jgi:hypothetical protein
MRDSSYYVVKALLDGGAQVDRGSLLQEGMTPLFNLARDAWELSNNTSSHPIPVMMLLLKYDANPNPLDGGETLVGYLCRRTGLIFANFFENGAWCPERGIC